MTGTKPSRRETLEAVVAQNPGDAFARYGLALECMNTGETEAAFAHFRALLEKNPDYVPGYQMFGQLLARLERKQEARDVLTRGMSAARKAGNLHAFSEMEGVLLELGA
jgi:thioredoxin-like negative regulator of GroEL